MTFSVSPISRKAQLWLLKRYRKATLKVLILYKNILSAKITIKQLGDTKRSTSIQDNRIHKHILFDLIDSHIKTNSQPKLSESENEKFVELLADIKDDEYFLKTISQFYRIDQYYYMLSGMKEEISLCQGLAVRFDVNSIEIENWEQLKSVRKDGKKQLKYLITEWRDLAAYKINLSINTVISILTLLGITFFTSGYIKAMIFYKWFGFEPSPFFTAEDYLVQSLDSIWYILLSSIVGLFVGFLKFNDDISIPEADLDVESKKDYNYRWMLITSVIILGAVQLYVNGRFPAYVILVLYYLTMFRFLQIIAFRYFKQGLSVMFAMVFFTLFSGSFGVNIFNSVVNAETKYEQYSFEGIDMKDFNVIGINTNYIFGINNKRQVLIHKKGEVSKITIQN